MNTDEMKIVLSFHETGAIKSKGQYDYTEKTNKGNLLPENRRLRVKKPLELFECKRTLTLEKPFIDFAISIHSRPPRRDYNREHLMWHTYSKQQRLEFHLRKYAEDMGGHQISYEIL